MVASLMQYRWHCQLDLGSAVTLRPMCAQTSSLHSLCPSLFDEPQGLADPTGTPMAATSMERAARPAAACNPDVRDHEGSDACFDASSATR